MVFLSLPSDLSSAWASLYTCKTLETNYLHFFVEQFFSSSSSSVIACPRIFEDGKLLPADELLFKTHNFVFLTCLASPNVFKTSGCVSQCTFFESK